MSELFRGASFRICVDHNHYSEASSALKSFWEILIRHSIFTSLTSSPSTLPCQRYYVKYFSEFVPEKLAGVAREGMVFIFACFDCLLSLCQQVAAKLQLLFKKKVKCQLKKKFLKSQ